jgi:hypothetical protein
MTGHKTKLPRGFKIKDGKVAKAEHYRDASHAIGAKKSKRTRPVRRVV